jgi:CheY-like chemotaxis protein/two-component sensor histidine kinase
MESVGRLTGGIAHDFNNLLAVVMANLEVLQARLPAGETRFLQLVDNAMRGAERGVALTQRLLAFARRQELKPEPVDVTSLVRDMADLLARSLGTAIQVETRLAPGLSPALVDATQLELAVLNLAVNARDAMPDGGRLAIEVDEAPGGRIRIRVTDTGTGMDEDILRQATEPFFTTKEVGKGTGLGLSMVHGLAAQSGGGFALRSRPGEGTTAEIVLPRAEGMAVAPAAPMPTYHLAAGRRGLSVLVVDDDPLVLSGTVRMLEALGHRVSEAASAFDALALLREGPAVDVVLTDEVMPGLRGLQLAGLIAREWPGLPVVLVTGYADLPPGADRLVAARLDKPFRVPALAAALAKACDGAGALRPAVAAAR